MLRPTLSPPGRALLVMVPLLLAGCGGGSTSSSVPLTSGIQAFKQRPQPDQRLPVASPQSASKSYKDVLYSFQGSPTDGSHPTDALVFDNNGGLFGNTFAGGPAHLGSVVKLKPAKKGYSETVIYGFEGSPDGAQPFSSPIIDQKGNIFGTTLEGGPTLCSSNSISGCGTVFELVPTGSTYTERILYSFQGGSDGYYPQGGLAADSSGALYGTTSGGSSAACACGTVFKLTPSGSGYTESTIYTFQGFPDAAYPVGTPLLDASGSIYGTTQQGGSASSCLYSGVMGCGAVYKLTPSGTSYNESIIYSLQGGADGANPIGGLISDRTGALYGTTLFGGTGSCTYYGPGCGVVFRLTPSGSTYSESVLYTFQGGKDGWAQVAPLTAGKKGVLYGTTTAGTACNCGTVFKLKPSGDKYTEELVYAFQDGVDGSDPEGGVIAGPGGELFGTTVYGGGKPPACGTGGCGTVYKVKQ
jgi:uncharacterized repeat protein (TIGR03803 family)